jgi:hypothetical protein
MLQLAQEVVVALMDVQGRKHLMANRTGKTFGDPNPWGIGLPAALSTASLNPILNLLKFSFCV